MASGVLKKTGSFVGTGAAKEISLDFTPRHVKTLNVDTMLECEAFEEGVITGAEGGIKTAANGDKSKLNAAAGITLGTRKFTVGTDASVNESGKRICYLAIE